MDPLYQEHILEHYKHPHHKGQMEDAEVTEKGHNASCGDDLVLYLKLAHDAQCSVHAARGTCCNVAIAEASFEGFGCAISQSGASMLLDMLPGKTRDAVSRLTKDDMDALYGTVIGPQREKCAMLTLTTLRSALEIGYSA